MLSAVLHSTHRRPISPGWPPIRARVATCCISEPLHGSPCATITARMNANAAAVTIQLSIVARLLPGRLRASGCPALMLNSPSPDQWQLVGPASSRHDGTTYSSRPTARATLEREEGWGEQLHGFGNTADNLPGWGIAGDRWRPEQLQPTAPMLAISARAALPKDGLGRLCAWPAAARTP